MRQLPDTLTAQKPFLSPFSGCKSDPGPHETIEGGFTMSDDIELIRGSGNVFRDFGRSNASVEQARAILAAKIIRTLDECGLSTREAERVTGVAHSEFSRIRNARLERFTLDRMIAILGKLDEDVAFNGKQNRGQGEATKTAETVHPGKRPHETSR
jgi:predicted XRE-type DNA-binding protein